ncbi:CAP domain-containing protein [Strongyloides ratti]|uniref:CAP domain-containing protein n=1 Tax=Strongyloides ratti TaxID=34506 RepID=A0A090LEB8_STRRB|nr:CAP domain-containing protein [Strongyloides ratti]CEF65850.1 CAP domain-containing protein [Strongyloides ratti]
MYFNFGSLLIILLIIPTIIINGFTYNYCIKRINGQLKYVYEVYTTKATTKATTLLPSKRIKIDSKKLNDLFLKQVNNRRKIHQVKPLKLDDNAVKAAQRWADECAKENKEKYDYNRDYTTSYQSFPINEYKDAIKKWYEEEKNHDYTYDYYTNASKHFAMIVWKEFTAMGCGFAQGAQKVFVVCKFAPFRTGEGAFKANVLKPKSKKN